MQTNFKTKLALAFSVPCMLLCMQSNAMKVSKKNSGKKKSEAAQLITSAPKKAVQTPASITSSHSYRLPINLKAPRYTKYHQWRKEQEDRKFRTAVEAAASIATASAPLQNYPTFSSAANQPRVTTARIVAYPADSAITTEFLAQYDCDYDRNFHRYSSSAERQCLCSWICSRIKQCFS